MPTIHVRHTPHTPHTLYTRTTRHTHHTHPEVPANVLSKLNRAIQLAKEGQTSLFKASQLLEFTSPSYKYARFASHDTYDLKRESQQLLGQYDRTFCKLVDCRIKADMAGAEAQQEDCFRCLGMSE